MTAYDIPSSDWSSDVCSSDLMASLLPCRSFLCGKAPRRATGRRERPQKRPEFRATIFANRTKRHAGATSRRRSAPARGRPTQQSTRGEGDRQSIVEGKRGPGRVSPGVRRFIEKKKPYI